jgi:hypothetical protein
MSRILWTFFKTKIFVFEINIVDVNGYFGMLCDET